MHRTGWEPAPPQAPPALLVTRDPAVREQLSRLAAAVGVGVASAPDAGSAGRAWLDAALVLVAADAVTLGVPVRRAGVLLVDASGDDDRVWRWAVEVGAEAVVRLPSDEGWLLERLAAAADGESVCGKAVGVVGGRGGAGASTLAAALAVQAVRRGRPVALVDADPAGGGLDLLLDADGEPGLRWRDLLDARGVLRGSVLRQGLPDCGGLRLLTWDRGPACDLPAGAVEAVLDACRRAHHLVVVDLPRRDDAPTVAALWRLDLLIVVVPAELRAAAAAAVVVERFARHVGDVRLVVRGPAPGDLSGEEVAAAVGLPLWQRWRYEPGLPAAGERREWPGRGRGPTAALAAWLLDEIDRGTP